MEEVQTTSSRGRQRRKNPKYSDYEVEVSPRVHSRRGRPAKVKAAEHATQQPVDGEQGAAELTPQELDGKNSEKKTSKRGRKTRGRKTPAGRTTPAGKSADVDAGLPVPGGESGHVDCVQQENGTPKPKRKYTKRKTLQTEPPVTETQSEEQSVQPDKEEEVEPGGRRRRSAAKM